MVEEGSAWKLQFVSSSKPDATPFIKKIEVQLLYNIICFRYTT